jgi:translation initiation factor IF-2
LVEEEKETVSQADEKAVVKMVRVIELPEALSVRQLAETLGASSIDVIKHLMRGGILANINQMIDYSVAVKVAALYGFKAKPQHKKKKLSAATARREEAKSKDLSKLPFRPPVVTIMGHVDHGKTKLLDTIRKANVVDSEVGGITQHIGAYQVEVNNKKVTFLDTPGHEAFTAMRARGAQVTDITVLVVAADDGIMPQTLEAIDHAKAADVPILIAINKVDKEDAKPDRVKQQLSEAGLVVEEWGGDVISVNTSAKTGLGIEELLENLLLMAEMEELRANPNQAAKGVVVEAKMDKKQGPMATVLIQDGTLRVGDIVVAGTCWGRIKAMFNDTGKRIRKAEPAMPAAILGLGEVPQVGDPLKGVSGEKQARALVEKRKAQQKTRARAVSLTNLYDRVSAGEVKELNLILRADVQGSVEPIKNSLEKLSTNKIQVNMVRTTTGNITENDVMLAVASHGLIVGFGIGVEAGALKLAESEGIDIRRYDIIYKLVEDVEKALKGMLEPVFFEVIDGNAEVREVFKASRHTKVAGVMVKDGKILRSSKVRIRRGKEIIHEGGVASMRRFKDNVNDIATGYEGGIGMKDFNKYEVGDILEFYHQEKSS